MVMISIFLTIIGRAFYLQVIQHQFLQAKADQMMLRTETIKAYRGVISDRYGVPLAVSTPLTTLWLDPKEYLQTYVHRELLKAELKRREIQPLEEEREGGVQTYTYPTELQGVAQQLKLKDEEMHKQIKDIRESKIGQLKYQLRRLEKFNANLDELAAAVSINPDEIRQKINQSPRSRFLVLKRQLPPRIAKVVLDRKFQSVYREIEYQRFYPQAQPNAQLIGITNSHDQGIEGLEMALNKRLSGQDGKIRVMRDKRGNRIKEVELIEAAISGEDIQLSIDSRLQYIMYRELAASGIANNARSATAVAIDVNTGEVLAMGSWPSFNPNDSQSGLANKDAMRNRAVIDMFEPGSTMKSFTVAAGMESGKYSDRSLIDTSPGSMVVGNHRIRDHHNNGVIDLRTLLVKSSNVASAKIALSLPNDTLPMFYKRMGFGQRTAMKFPGESPGLILPPTLWNTAEVATMSYGYAINVTALQLAQAYSVLASGGVFRPVTLFKQETPPVGERILDEGIARSVVHMLEGVTEDGGTAKQAAIAGYRVAGKTGTAHKLRPDGRGYSPSDYRALFVGMAPASNPQIVLAVVVENPVGQYYGGLVSAPIFAKIMQESLRLRNVPLDKPLDVSTAKTKS
jgi:cell division protein FtsI (penicillin-binding protein 3)